MNFIMMFMDKEFIFEGKKYISTKRAGLIYGYNPDYVGQLCREGLIDGKIVGRSWFVLEDAIKNHKDQAGQKNKIRGFKQVSDAMPVVLQDTHVPTFHISSVGSIDPQADPRAVSQHTFSEVPVAVKVAFAAMVAIIVSTSLAGVSRVDSLESLQLATEKPLEALPSVASVGTIALDVEVSLRKAYGSVLSVLTSRTTTSDSHAAARGVVVVPTNPAISATARAQVKKHIQESFSDEVRVVPDSDTSSGIVTPVFKNERDQNYMYVMVPLKE